MGLLTKDGLGMPFTFPATSTEKTLTQSMRCIVARIVVVNFSPLFACYTELTTEKARA